MERTNWREELSDLYDFNTSRIDLNVVGTLWWFWTKKYNIESRCFQDLNKDFQNQLKLGVVDLNASKRLQERGDIEGGSFLHCQAVRQFNRLICDYIASEFCVDRYSGDNLSKLVLPKRGLEITDAKVEIVVGFGNNSNGNVFRYSCPVK